MKTRATVLSSIGTVLALALLGPSTVRAETRIADHVVREKVAGIDVLADKTGVEEVVTFNGSLPAGDSFAPADNIAIPTLVGAMLDKGTTTEDKYAIAQKLDNIGAQISFSVRGVMVYFGGKCLRKDLPLVISLLAEELRHPAFPDEEFAKVKKHLAGGLQRAQENTSYRASQLFSEAIFPVGHPDYQPPTQEFLAAVAKADLAEVKKFHADNYGPAQATLVVVGDVDLSTLKNSMAQAFAGWSGGRTVPDFPMIKTAAAPPEQIIRMADKPNVTVILGQATGMRYRDPDSLALRVGNAVLGSGFTGRLMSTVRDKEGLTYGIGSSVSNDTFSDGSWQITANFAPQLLDKGIASTRRELDIWYAHGITAAELERVKTNLIGSFKVALTTTDGLAGVLLSTVHRGYDVAWIDDYPKRLAAVSLAEVNAAIKQHLQPAKMIVIEAGSVPVSPAHP